MADAEHEVLTWERFGAATRAVARAIVADGFAPEVVVAVARGGLLPGGAIAYALGVKQCGAINVEFYTGVGTMLDAPELLPPRMDLGYLAGRRVLLVDDVADSGRTLALVVSLLRAAGAEVRSATVYTKPGSAVRPDYWWRETPRWIDFPWSAAGSVIEEDAR
ncbi:MAG: phosphoribosyltransferase [Microbacterium sp.]|uniref:phosphoribosyltransferase n=1 Tax=Microbacterium sp. TaxID=51671 RepID=UPI001ACC0C60|nr:phosphoribosyltransferase [Microbacterium sp.]MBN9171039.1 phosphoribosyltransferase [Microbacterium sp.]MBN9188089.1 phosphoribosyltransferase [Microbacterium sp.]MBN9192740.1 phosphoribosyltransferase [Microbacterium sp.]